MQFFIPFLVLTFMATGCAINQKNDSFRKPATCRSGLTPETLAQSVFFAPSKLQILDIKFSKDCDTIVLSQAVSNTNTAAYIHVLTEKQTSSALEQDRLFQRNIKYESAMAEIMNSNGLTMTFRDVSVFRGGEVSVGPRLFYMDQYVLISKPSVWNEKKIAGVVTRLADL